MIGGKKRPTRRSATLGVTHRWELHLAQSSNYKASSRQQITLDWICLEDTASLLLFGYKLDKQVKAIKECISIPTIHRYAITASKCSSHNAAL